MLRRERHVTVRGGKLALEAPTPSSPFGSQPVRLQRQLSDEGTALFGRALSDDWEHGDSCGSSSRRQSGGGGAGPAP
jgi:hypothetical protein